MIRKHRFAPIAHPATNYSVSVPSASALLRKTCAKPEAYPLPHTSSPIPFASNLSASTSLCVKYFKMRTSSKNTDNSFRFCTSKRQNLKPFRICSYKKNREAGGAPPSPNKPSVPTQKHPQPFSVHSLTHDSLHTRGVPPSHPRILRASPRTAFTPTGSGRLCVILSLSASPTHHSQSPTHFPNFLPRTQLSVIVSPEQGERLCQ